MQQSTAYTWLDTKADAAVHESRVESQQILFLTIITAILPALLT